MTHQYNTDTHLPQNPEQQAQWSAIISFHHGNAAAATKQAERAVCGEIVFHQLHENNSTGLSLSGGSLCERYIAFNGSFGRQLNSLELGS
jgi:hypothetical protein